MAKKDHKELCGATAATRIKQAPVKRSARIAKYIKQKDHVLSYEHTTRELRNQKWIKLTLIQQPNDKSKKERCQQLIARAFGKELAFKHVARMPMDEARLQATTDKQNEEKLTQKLEKIDEPSLVEAGSSKVEGFNTTPKVLGHCGELKSKYYKGKSPFDKNINVTLKIDKDATKAGLKQTSKPGSKHEYSDDRATFSSDVSKETRKSGYQGTPDLDLEAIAKRCLDSPTGNIDRRILKEMEKLGVPHTGQKSTLDKNVIESDLVENMDVSMKKPKKQIEKLAKEVDLETRQIEKGALAFTILYSNCIPVLHMNKIIRLFVTNTLNPLMGHTMQSPAVINSCNYCSNSIIRGTMEPTDVNMQSKAKAVEGVARDSAHPNEETQIKLDSKAELLKRNTTRVGPLPLPKDTTSDIQLSQLLERTRRRSLEDCKLFEVKIQEAQVEPETGKCGGKKPPCPPPAPTCPPSAPKCPPPPPKSPPPKTKCPPPAPKCPPPEPKAPPPAPKCPRKPVCPPPEKPPGKPPCPPPKKPTCPPPKKPTCPPPEKPPCPSPKTPPCPPPKKPACAPKKKICPPPNKSQCPGGPAPAKKCPPPPPRKCKFVSPQCTDADTVQSLVMDFKKYCSKFDEIILIAHRSSKSLTTFANYISDIVYAREFDPWIPIPSWPHPKKYVKRPLQCPKDGCPVALPPKDGEFCKPLQKPCTGFPKRATISDARRIPLQLKIFYIGEF